MKLTSLLENETAQRWITDPAKIVEYIKAARLGEKEDYQINKDGTVDFFSDVIFSPDTFSTLYKDERFPHFPNTIPLKFGTVDGSFDVTSCRLKSLEGCPTDITHSFKAAYNIFPNLKGGPKRVGGDYIVTWNSALTSLEGMAEIVALSANLGNTSISEEDFKYLPKKMTNLRINDCQNIKSISSLHKYVQEISRIISITHLNLEGGLLGLLKIKGLQTYQYGFKEEGKLAKALEIIDEFLPVKSDSDLFDCQEKLMDAGLEEYARI